MPSHLFHMLFELFKNSMRAVMEHYYESESEYPPIEVIVSRGKEDICVKVSFRRPSQPLLPARRETDASSTPSDCCTQVLSMKIDRDVSPALSLDTGASGIECARRARRPSTSGTT